MYGPPSQPISFAIICIAHLVTHALLSVLIKSVQI